MLTKERTSKTRKLKYAAVALALLAVLVFCFASCGKATPTGIEYQSGTAAKVEYNQGETFDCTGAKIKVTYDNGAVETKDVTPEMVGNAPLTLGVESISVTYSENGAAVVGYIPVVVKDPFSAQKAEAIEGLYENALVVANKTDKGVDILIRDYTAKINEATAKAAIDTVVENFEAALDAYLGKKADILAKFDNDADLVATIAKLHAQFATDIATAMENAKANINAASTIDEAESYFVAFVAAVNNKLAEQEFYEDEKREEGQIYDKIALLQLIEDYQNRSALLKDIVKNALASGQITTDAYEKAMSLATGYPFADARLSWWEKYITLAIDLSGLEKEIKKDVEDLLTTDVDRAAAYLLDGENIYPIEYVLRKGEYINGEDATGKTIAYVNAFFASAEKQFGAAGLETLKKEYGVKNGEILIDKVLEKITAKYTALQAIRTAGVPVMALIETAYTTAEGDAKKTAIETAWKDLKSWGTTNGVFSLDDKITLYNNLVYDKNFTDVVYEADLFEGVWQSADKTWKPYASNINEAYVVKYFIPNLAKLVEATQAQEAYEAKQLAAAIPAIDDIVYSYTDADSNATIEAAEFALATFKKTYGDEIYNKYFVVDGKDATKETVDAARKQYGDLVKMAADANAAIDTYEKILADANNKAGRTTIRSDYESAEAPLKKAYKLYCDFAKANTRKSDGKIFTDVIEQLKGQDGKIADTKNESNLVAYMDAYVALAYAEERHVQADLIINEAWNKRAGDNGNIPTDQTNFRTALQNYKQKAIDTISTDKAYEYKTTFDTNNDGTVDLEKNNFNYDEILKANLDVVKAVAKAEATKIAGCTFEGGALKFPTA